MLEPKARIKSGLIAVALGLTSTLSTLGVPFSLGQNVAVGQTPPTPYVQPAGAPDQLYGISNQRLREARKALAGKDIVSAERIATEVKAMNLVYRDIDDRPDQILALIHQCKNVAVLGQQSPGSDQFRRAYANISLVQADGLLRHGEIDLATQLAQEASMQNAAFNQIDVQNGLEPQVMFKRIEDARRARSVGAQAAATPVVAQPLSQTAQWQLNQAIEMLSQARTALNAGQLDRAEQVARVAAGLNLPESAFPQGGDTPNRLLADIAARRPAAPIAVASTGTVPAATVPAATVPAATVPAVYNPATDSTQTVQVRDNGAAPAAPAPTLQQAAPLVATNTPIVDQAQRNQHIIVQQIASEIMQQISDANRMSHEKNDPEGALRILAQAKARVETSNLDPQTKANFTRNIDNAIANTQQFNVRHQPMLDQNAINEQVRTDIRMEQEDRINRQQILKTYVDECGKLIQDQRYEEAVRMAKKAREFAPDDPVANMLYTSTQLVANVRMSQMIEDAKREGVVEALREVDLATIPYSFKDSSVIYDKNFRNRMMNRVGSDQLIESRRPQSEQDIFRQLEMPVSLNVDRPMPLGYVLQLLRAQTGVEIFVDHPSLREVDVTTDTPVAIQLMKEIKLKSVLNLVLGQLNLTYIVKNEMLNITSVAKARGEYYPKTYYVGDLIMGIRNFDGTFPVDFERSIERGMRHSVVPTRGQMNRGFVGAANLNGDPNLASMTANPDTLAQMNRSGNLSSQLASNGFNMPGQEMQNNGGAQTGASGGTADFGPLMDLIEAVVAPDSWNEGGQMQEYFPNLSLVIRQTEEVHAEIVELLNQLRKMNDLQITVEVRFITLTDDFYEQMGLDFNVFIPNSGAAARTELGITSGGSSGSGSSGSDGDGGLSIVGGQNVTVGLSGPTSPTSDLRVPFTQNNGVSIPFGAPGGTTGLTTGFAILSDIQAFFFLKASQGDSRANVMQAPRVTIFNGQMGSIMDMSMRPFVTSVIPVVGDFAAGYQPIITVLNEGQLMTVQGVVSSNRQYVRLTLNPVFTKITKVESYKYVGEDSLTEETESSAKGDDKSPTSGDERASKKKSSRNTSGVTIQLPILATLSVQTTVSVPDGGTILLGGIKRLEEGREEVGTPILNKIPYLNRLFMNTAIGRSTTSMMMMVTPRIVIQEEEEEYLTGN